MINEWLTADWWLNPQIDYLVWLQNIRLSTAGAFDNLFLHITAFGELVIPTIVVCIIYWCIDLDAGFYLFTLQGLGLFVTKFLKMAGCIYRPWVLSDRIKPVNSALKMAGGYSFPSGHTAMAVNTWGGLAILLKKHKFISTLLILFVVLIGFSRNYLGVHTPQDVLASLITCFAVAIGGFYFIKWCNKDKKRYFYFLAVFNIVCLISLYYVLTKEYRIDYFNGEKIANPQRAIYSFVMYIGWIMGMINGATACKIFTPFTPKKGSIKSRICIGFVGTLILLLLFKTIGEFFSHGIHNYYLTYISMFTVSVYLTFGYPLIIRKFYKN